MQLGVAASRAETCTGTKPNGQRLQEISAVCLLLAHAAVLCVQPGGVQTCADENHCSSTEACGLTLGLGLADRCVMSPGICSNRRGRAAE